MNLVSRDRAVRGDKGTGFRNRWLIVTSWALSVFYMAAIFFVSGLSDPPVPAMWNGGDFFLHMAAYAGLGFLLSWALVNSGVVRKLVFFAFLIGLFYGTTDELHQYFVPQRTASLLDLTADGLGSLLGSYFFHILHSTKSAT